MEEKFWSKREIVAVAVSLGLLAGVLVGTVGESLVGGLVAAGIVTGMIVPVFWPTPPAYSPRAEFERWERLDD